jgi:hypothetical protein
MTLVAVDRAALARLLGKTWDMFLMLAEEAGFEKGDLEAGSELVLLAVQAGLPIPGPMAPGHLPPPPPEYLDQLTAPTYRDHEDKLRCCKCKKVVYGNQAQAHKAVQQIYKRQPMKWYRGGCGHYHLSSIKRINLPPDFK